LIFTLDVKIFVSYSRRDAGDFAEQIRRHLTSFNHTVFTDINSINVGDIWNNIIEDNISNCDIFVVIITHGSLISPHVEKEFLQAQTENKIIIPCFHRDVNKDGIKWDLSRLHGIEFEEEFELARNLYSTIMNNKKIAETRVSQSIQRQYLKLDYPINNSPSKKYCFSLLIQILIFILSVRKNRLLHSVPSASEMHLISMQIILLTSN
jgi:hypothetical protein